MGKMIIDLVFMLMAGGFGYWVGISHYFGNVETKKTVRVGDKFYRITKVEMTEKDVDQA